MPTDAELMQRLQAGDSSALDSLITCHQSVLRRHLERYVSPADAEDLLQEVWLRAWQRAGQWEGRGRALAWLLAIATNLALNHLRRRRAVEPLGSGDAHPEESEWDDPPDVARLSLDATVPGPEEQAVWRDQLARAQEALSMLPADMQVAVRLVRVEGRRLEEAAHLLGIPVGTLKSRLHRAQRALVEQLEEEE